MKIIQIISILALIESIQTIEIKIKRVQINNQQKLMTTDMRSNIEPAQFTEIGQTNNIQINLTNYYNFQYIGEIKLGSQQQPMDVLFDTGSTVTWVTGEQNNNYSYQSGYSDSQQFICRMSKTCISHPDQKQIINYGKGTVKGYFINDDVLINGLKITYFKMLSVYYKYDIEFFQGSGIVGMGFSRHKDQLSFIDQLADQKQIDKRQYSFYLSRNSMETDSKLIIGTPNSQYYQGNIIKFPVSSSNMWNVYIERIVINDKEVASENEYQALIDSGTSLVLVPQAIFTGFLLEMKNSGKECGYISGDPNNIYCRCDIESKYPTVNIQIVDINHNIQKFELNNQDYFQDDIYESSYCQLNIQPFDSDFIILGDMFMQKYYSVYDLDEQSIGFAGSKYISKSKRHQMNQIMMYILIIMFGILIIGLMVYNCTKRNRVLSQNQQNQDRLIPDQQAVNGQQNSLL